MMQCRKTVRVKINPSIIRRNHRVRAAIFKTNIMNCPYCNKEVYGLTGLQELQKFQKHLRTCKKHPDRRTVVETDGSIVEIKPNPTMMQALNIRHDSGQ